jgi:hypothetical protein
MLMSFMRGMGDRSVCWNLGIFNMLYSSSPYLYSSMIRRSNLHLSIVIKLNQRITNVRG